MAPPKQKGNCKCGWLERAADDPKSPIEFDKELNEYHLVRGPNDYHLIYYCPFCGGNAPKSKRNRLFHALSNTEIQRLLVLTQKLQTVQDVTRAFGSAQISKPIGITITLPQKRNKPETTQSYPVMIYTNLSAVADVHVTIYPRDTVGFSFAGKAIEKKAC